MAVAIVNKFLDALGLSNENDQEVENEDVYEFDEGKDEDEETKGGIFGSIGSKKSKIVSYLNFKMLFSLYFLVF